MDYPKYLRAVYKINTAKLTLYSALFVVVVVPVLAVVLSRLP
jgi:hypothetical protein